MKQRRILYVADNPNNVLLISRIVQVEGHQLLEAKNGEEGWNVTHSERPDLIIMDVLMPEMDAFELTRKIKRTREVGHIPIVITAYDNPEIEGKAKTAGCDGFLSKPADIRQIQAVLRQFLGDSAAMTRVL